MNFYYANYQLNGEIPLNGADTGFIVIASDLNEAKDKINALIDAKSNEGSQLPTT